MLGFLLLMAVVALWCGWPWAAAWYENRSLPKTWRSADGSFTLVEVSATPLPTNRETQLQVTIPASRAREVVNELRHLWIPPLVIQGGLSAAGTLSVKDLGPGERPWQAETTWGGEVPVVLARVPVSDVNRLIATRLAMQKDGPLTRCVLDQLRITNDDPPGTTTADRRFAIDAAGQITVRYLGTTQSFAIRHLGAYVHVHFEPLPLGGPSGRRPQARLEVTDLDTPALNIPFISQFKNALMPMIEQAVNTSLAIRLANTTVPDWCPTDVRIDAMVVADQAGSPPGQKSE